MKIILLIIVLSSFTLLSFAQTNNCAKFKNGTFKMTYNGLTAIIKRNGNYQHEETVNPKMSVSFDVTWLDDCHYTLKPREDLFKQFPRTPKNALINVTITATSKNSYTQSSKSNFTKNVITGEMIKID